MTLSQTSSSIFLNNYNYINIIKIIIFKVKNFNLFFFKLNLKEKSKFNLIKIKSTLLIIIRIKVFFIKI